MEQKRKLLGLVSSRFPEHLEARTCVTVEPAFGAESGLALSLKNNWNHSAH